MNILIVGLGSIAKKHIVAIRKIKHTARIFALRSGNCVAAEEGVVNLYSTADLKAHHFDFAIISNPTSNHRSSIAHLVSLNIPLFIEKPLFHKVGEAEERLLEKINEAGIPTYVACNLRFLDCLQFIKSELNGKRINEVNIYCGSYLPDWRAGQNFRKIYSANKELGGGVHIDLIHELDYTYWLFGKPIQTKAVFTNSSSLDISAHDYANYVWKYENFTASIILNYYRRDTKRILEIVCDNGTYSINLLENSVSFGSEIIFSSEQKILNTYDAQMTYFISQITENKGSDFNTVFEAYKILKLCIEE